MFKDERTCIIASSHKTYHTLKTGKPHYLDTMTDGFVNPVMEN